ncbi:Crp/Fnr family transcriptional regulator [Flavisphingomonas formosensis]|uniref:Crp/Fnr family transcriptional regulator n=1 Tax=Flavisphingomonas formosensis TaxID=861534 RepID=UPI0012FB86C0|nr:Crp/Fnr family transcriptional regulator [Sphingomonas formosensis]
MSGSCFAERLEHYLPLTPKEKDAIARLEEQERSYRRGTVVRRENDRAQELFVIRSGWMYSYVLLDDGSRQILRLHFPGDVVGTSSAAFVDASDSLVALTDVKLCPFDKLALRPLFEHHPRLAALMFVIAQAERVSLTDRLASLGRTSAKARVAALLLDTLDRLRVMKSDIGSTFHFPLTQEEIGDATGLTAVHVNRMMRALVEEGHIERSNSHVTLIEEQRLAQVANYINRYAALDTSWLPAAS